MGDIPYEVLQQGGWVGPRFRGVFFFRDVFWRVVVPLVWGTRSINALDGLAVMPAQIKQRLVSVPKTRDEYLLLWADCVDYDMGFQDLAPTLDPASFLNEMVQSVERELQSTIADLCQERPNSNAMYSARNCTEKALKPFLCNPLGGHLQGLPDGLQLHRELDRVALHLALVVDLRVAALHVHRNGERNVVPILLAVFDR